MNNMENNTLLESFLSKLTLFSGLNKEEFEIVTAALITVNVKKGDSIFYEGDEGKEMYVFFSGLLSAFVMQSDGTQRKLFDVKLGDFFGEMSIIAQEPRSVTITAMDDSTVIMLKEDDFYSIISGHPIIGFKLLRTISFVQNRWLDQMSKAFSDLLRWGETARRRAITDEMTGLYNRLFLEESLKERFNNQSMSFRIMSLLMMDLDKIHGINERHGTKGGDAVIIAAANIISSCIRPGDIAARLAGDEFTVLLPDTDAENAAKIAERIRESIEKCQVEVPVCPDSVEKVLISTRTSIGIALAPLHAKTTEDLVDKSDTALMKAKELGRNRVEVYS
jgi:diguanylate cyclase (GGDEF)-like protein